MKKPAVRKRERMISNVTDLQPTNFSLPGLRLHVEYQRPGDLKPPRRALRGHDKTSIMAIEASIKENGFLVPILVDAGDNFRRKMGRTAFEAQYQQQPVPEDGIIIKRAWLRYSEAPPEEFDVKLTSWDTASTLSEDADWSVGTVWGLSGVRCIYSTLSGCASKCQSFAAVSSRCTARGSRISPLRELKARSSAVTLQTRGVLQSPSTNMTFSFELPLAPLPVAPDVLDTKAVVSNGPPRLMRRWRRARDLGHSPPQLVRMVSQFQTLTPIGQLLTAY